ncbi:uncharacterized protein LOC102803509 [Saccoglossus kowalevskii]|uniref:Tripartite motif-containing protein 2-like n=1 Tax=Saccoglossus kowalevskii TaxID=10224 RepID=A0ABM0MP12_SACKO|nr:PREDICTED: tripartite motif-containing protein 2-like [Saccoglossus kowalevskii]
MENDFLKCAVCLDVYNEPRLLPCGHTFCFQCIQNIRKHNEDQLKCALCRAKHIIPLQGIEAFLPNYYILSAVEIKKNGSCGVKLAKCSTCFILPVLSSVYCTSHEQSQMKLFCQECNSPICLQCVTINEKHCSHKFMCLPGIIEKRRADIKTLMLRVVSVQEDFKDMVTKKEELLIGDTDENLRDLVEISKSELSSTEWSSSWILKVEEALSLAQSLLDDKDDISFLIQEENVYCNLLTVLQEKFTSVTLDIWSSSVEHQIEVQVQTTDQSIPLTVYDNGSWQMLQMDQNEVLESSIATESTQNPESTFSMDRQIPQLQCDMQFHRPCGLAASQQGCMFVADSDRSMIYQYAGLHGRAHVFHLPGITEACQPAGICVTQNNILYIADAANSCIIIYDVNQRRLIRQIGMDVLDTPFDVSVLPDGRICALDWSCHCVKIFTQYGSHVGTFGSYGDGAGEFKFPWSIAVNSQDQLIITDNDNHRVQVLDSFGQFLYQFGSRGRENGELENPKGVAVDGNDNIYVCSQSAIQLFSPQGVFLQNIISRRDNSRISPHAATVFTSLNRNSLAVSDIHSKTVRIFPLGFNFES